MYRSFPRVFKDEASLKVYTLGVILLFVYLADAILSYWVPNFIENTFQSSIMMGLIISFSSIIGFGSDIFFPQVLRVTKVGRLIGLGIITSLLFSVLLFKVTFTPTVLILLVAMAVWGIYYELLGFGEQQFIADAIPLKSHTSAWGILTIFRSLAYFFGPLLAGFIILNGETLPLIAAFLLTSIGLMILFLTKNKHERPMQIEVREVNLIRELTHWKALFIHVWPVIVMSTFIGIIDATFWTTGAVWTEALSTRNFWGSLFLPLYTLPSLFMGIVIARWGIVSGKKRLSEKFLLFSGLFLVLLGVSSSIFLQLFFVFISSILLSAAFPLVDAVYSDIVARMGRERRHLIGLSRSTISIAYIVGPILAGFIANAVGASLTFSVVGFFAFLVSVILLLTTPKKLRLPQVEIHEWE